MHGLEKDDNMMYIGEVPWHGLGTYVGDEPVDSKEALEKSGLDWKVEKQPIYLADTSQVPDYFAVVRQTDNKALGVVGSRYQPIQNVDCFDFADNLIKDGEMKYHTAGSFYGGKRIWLLGKVGSSQILKDDLIDKYFFLLNSHDGSNAVHCMFTNVRVVCRNTSRMALLDGNQNGTLVKVRHSANAQDKFSSIQKLMTVATKSFEKEDEWLRYLTTKLLKSDDVQNFLQEMFPIEDDATDKKKTRTEKAQGNLLYLFENGTGIDIPGVKGTAYQMYNALIEYTNFFKTARGGQTGRFESLIMGSGNQFLQKGYQTLNSLVA